MPVMVSITFLPHVNDFDIALLNCPHQAIVHVVVDLRVICVEVWMVKNPLDQVFQLSRVTVGIVLTDVVLQNSLCEKTLTASGGRSSAATSS